MAIERHEVDIASELETEEDIELFIEACIEEAKNDTNPMYLIHTLTTAVRAHDIINTTKDTGHDYSSLYYILSGETDPRISTIAELANALGYRLTFEKRKG